MKNHWKTLLLLPLLCALATAPLPAETSPPQSDAVALEAPIVTNDGAKSAPAAPTAPPAPPAPPSPPSNENHWSEPSNVVLLVPIVGTLSVFGVFALFLYFRHRRNRMLHETLRAMIEKGVPIPPELLQPPAPEFRRRERNDLRTSIIMIGVGLGLIFAHIKVPGFILLFLGLAFFVVWKLEAKPKQNQIDNQNPNQP